VVLGSLGAGKMLSPRATSSSFLGAEKLFRLFGQNIGQDVRLQFEQFKNPGGGYRSHWRELYLALLVLATLAFAPAFESGSTA